MNTGRNLTVVSVGIILYVLSGADFRAAGVGGLSWEIEYPGVIKFAAVAFWFWLVILHWLTRTEGEYYKAWAGNATRHDHGHVPRQSNPERPKERVDEDLAKVGQHFGVALTDRAKPAHDYSLQFVDSADRPGIYVVQCAGYKDMESAEARGFMRSTPKWSLPPISARIGFLKLHWRYPDVFFRAAINNPEVVSRRLLPWIFAFVVAVVFALDLLTEWVEAVGPWVESLSE